MDEARQVRSGSQDEPLFTISWEHERDSIPMTLSAMLAANVDDRAFCAWLRGADKIGLEYRAGGGAAPLCIVRRVS